MLSLDTGVNPLKVMGSTKFLPQIEVMLDRRKKEYPPTMKKLSIEVNIPEYLVKMAADKDTREAQKAIVDLTLIAFYYLLQVAEYTCRERHNDETQTVQFRFKDVTSFR